MTFLRPWKSKGYTTLPETVERAFTDFLQGSQLWLDESANLDGWPAEDFHRHMNIQYDILEWLSSKDVYEELKKAGYIQ